MESISIMVAEHDNIKRLLKVVRAFAYLLMTENKFDQGDLNKIVDFIKNYADKHHHGKEEEVLFESMDKHLDKLSQSGALTGMFIEHDLGRLYVSSVLDKVNEYMEGNDEARIDIIGNLIAYTDLLSRHINKEDNIMYKFAENQLTDEIKLQIDAQCKQLEDKASLEGVQEKYISLLEYLEEKYIN